MAPEENAQYGPGGRGFYGAVTVSERGQIALPAQARRDLGIKPGDKLLVLGVTEHEQLVAGLDAEVPPGLGGECDLAALADRDRAVEAPASKGRTGRSPRVPSDRLSARHVRPGAPARRREPRTTRPRRGHG